MVNRVGSRAGAMPDGASLVELAVALVLLATGVLATLAAATASAALLRRAETEERATRIAAMVLDSLAQVPEPAPGSAEIEGFSVRWRGTVDGVLEVTVVDREPEAWRVLLATRHARPLPARAARP